MWSVFADVKTAADLRLPTPDLAVREDGQRAPATVAVQPTVELEQFIEHLGERAEAVAAKRVDPSEDYMLIISTDGRKAALDIRMVLTDGPSGPTKIDAAADAIHRVWEQTRNNEYLDTITGEPSPICGALQLVFSDIGTPNLDRWNAYDELHLQLVSRGMPGERVRFMHEAKTDVEKARMFAAARAGHIAVLIGSTQKNGVGTNVQARAIALYHLDCPWRPSDIAQREGRIMRQGNQNPEVAIVRFVTERSFDSYMWQGVECKATFIAQLMRGRLDSREIEEIDSSALSAAEAKAISSGNPLLLEHSTLSNEVTRLRRLERAYQRNEHMLTHTRREAQHAAERASEQIAGLEAALPRVIDTSGERFRIQLHDRNYDSRVQAAAALARWANSTGLKRAPRYTKRDYGPIGQISGFEIQLAVRPGMGGLEAEITLDGVPRSTFRIDSDTLLDGQVGLIQRIENRVSGIPTLLAGAREDLAAVQQTVTDAGRRIGQPFRHAEPLHDAERHLADVEAQLAELNDDTEPGLKDPPEEPLETRLTVQKLHAQHPPPAGPAPAERPTPPSFVPAAHQARQPRKTPDLSM